MAGNTKTELFETVPVPRALMRMAVPTIISQLITLIYNMADTWFIGRAGNPYMVAASSILAAVRQVALNIPILFLLNSLWGMMGIVWTQAAADLLNVMVSYIIYASVLKQIISRRPN